GVRVGHYHAGRTKLARERAQQAFEAGRTRVLVATNAFGMGIDLPDIRLIVHFQTPGSIEAYYQEAGRAGRDGEPARCLLFFGLADLATQRRLSERSSSSAAQDERREAALAGIERYARDERCRHAMLVRHFTGREEEPECGRCDVCRNELAEGGPGRPARSMDACAGDAGSTLASGRRGGMASEIETLPETALESIVSAVDRLSRPVGRRNLAQALRGGKAKTLSRGGLLTLPEYGTLSAWREDDVLAAIDGLLAAGRLQRTGRKYPTVWIPGKPVRGGAGRAGATRRGANSSGTDAQPGGAGVATGSARSGASGRSGRRPARYGGDIARALDNYRKRKARALGWKTYMVFQRKVILAIDREEPDSLEALARIPGLGPAKIERFGEDVLSVVRQHRRKGEG
ncbi:MAG TPA: hypothetical protein ENK11_06820, partial [Phycisphaerales bacterium]|nr:hypothetical protein [Phycisphaerales bacterium]